MRSLIPALVLAFTVYCVIDVVRSEESDIRGLPKVLWVFVVLLFPLAGGAAWFVAGRPRGTKPPGTDRISRPKPRVVGPDDDPDFLRTIDRPTPVDPAGPVAAPDGPPTASPGQDDGGRSHGGRSGGSPSTDGHGPDEHDDPTGQDDRRP